MTLVECLANFNRKERYWLIRNALGRRNEQIPLSAEFRKSLEEALGRDIPESAWWALDYHIDWLIGALLMYAGSRRDDVGDNPKIVQGDQEYEGRAIQGSQQDFDFVVAFDNIVILIEAKATGAWDDEQLESKCTRLYGLRTLCSDELPEIYFILMSPEVRPLTQKLPKNIEKLESISLWFDNTPTSFMAIGRHPSINGTKWRLF